MAAYLRFYQFEASPFESSDRKPAIVLGTRSLRGAFDQVKRGLDEDSPRICLTGSTGIGKTSFCRALPRLLGEGAKVATILNPRLAWREIRDLIAKKFDLEGGALSRRALLEAGCESKQLVLIIDDAEHLSHESLDHLDILLQYKRDDGKQLLHCVMLANLDSAATGVELPILWWLDKLTTLQLQFSPIPVEGIRHYVEKHLAKAGWAGGELFTENALKAIHRNTGGLPRAINALCEKILMEGGLRGINSISANFIEQLCDESSEPRFERPLLSSPEVSADFSIGSFGPSMSAQELLDASNPHSKDVSYEEARVAPDSEYLKNRPPELQSLILTQDSNETLSVESEPKSERQAVRQHSLTIELEDDPAERPSEPDFRASRNIGAAVVLKRSASESRARKGFGGRLAIAAMALVAAYWINSQFSLPTQLIDRAEGKITKVLDRKPAEVGPSEVTENAEDIDEVVIKPVTYPSLIDRADEIAAQTGLDSLPLPELERDEVAIGASNETAMPVDPVEAQPAIPQPISAPIPALRPAPQFAETPPATTPTKPSAQVSKTPTSDDPMQVPVATASHPNPTAKISDELVVINEYTAIPQAAATVPKVPLPSNAKSEVAPAMIDTGSIFDSKAADIVSEPAAKSETPSTAIESATTPDPTPGTTADQP